MTDESNNDSGNGNKRRLPFLYQEGETEMEPVRQLVVTATQFAGGNLPFTFVVLIILGAVSGWLLHFLTSGDFAAFGLSVCGFVIGGFAVIIVAAAAVYGLAAHPDWNDLVVTFVYFVIPLAGLGVGEIGGWKLNTLT